MIDLRIRAATRDDAGAVLAFWSESAEGTSVSDDLAGVTRLVERDPEALILAVADGVIVGSVIAGWDGWRASSTGSRCCPRTAAWGVSTALLRAAEERFLTLGGRRVDAMVLVANETGQLLWTAAGYERQEQWRRWVKPLTE